MTEANDPLAWVARAEDAQEAIELAKLVRKFARKFIGL
jgi:hypothetical protein